MPISAIHHSDPFPTRYVYTYCIYGYIIRARGGRASEMLTTNRLSQQESNGILIFWKMTKHVSRHVYHILAIPLVYRYI